MRRRAAALRRAAIGRAAVAGCTVADVLADPQRFEGETLADPLEGVGYGPSKASIMRRADGTPWIYTFAHGRTVYELRHNAPASRRRSRPRQRKRW